jgi:hypothetical protein
MYTKMAIAIQLVSGHLVTVKLEAERTEKEPHIEADDNLNNADNAPHL